MTEYLNQPEIHQLTGYVLGPDAPVYEQGDYPGGGIYMLFAEDGELLYIGQSLNVGYRVVQHKWAADRKERMPFAEFSMLDVPSGLMRHIECAHIHALSPSENHRPRPDWEHHDLLVRLVKQAWGTKHE
jgi:hypothetical protein